jgi:hypothetical protein
VLQSNSVVEIFEYGYHPGIKQLKDADANNNEKLSDFLVFCVQAARKYFKYHYIKASVRQFSLQ